MTCSIMLRTLLRSLALMLGLATVGAASAQATSVSLGAGFDREAPVEITADSLSLDRDSGTAQFAGGVMIVQGGMELKAGKVTVTYADEGSDIESMVATGGVTFISGEDLAESQQAIYKPDSGTLQMRGDVILTQGNNAIASETLDIDLETGNGVLTGRVRVVVKQ